MIVFRTGPRAASGVRAGVGVGEAVGDAVGDGVAVADGASPAAVAAAVGALAGVAARAVALAVALAVGMAPEVAGDAEGDGGVALDCTGVLDTGVEVAGVPVVAVGRRAGSPWQATSSIDPAINHGHALRTCASCTAHSSRLMVACGRLSAGEDASRAANGPR